MTIEPTQEFARRADAADPLASFRERFHIPKRKDGADVIYLCGNSLGLQPKSTRTYIEQELHDWETLGVEGHVHAQRPWMPYHEFLADSTARIVGATPREVVNMNGLTVNLHLLMVSFYRPTRDRFKIVIEANAFPSDRYAVVSQIAYHGFDPETALVELRPRALESAIRTEDIEDYLAREGASVALVLFSGVNYYSGQAFDMPRITRAAQAAGTVAGFDLAHAAGNLELHLHEWNVDFAAWCGYKYLNGGPGAIAGAFVHERHAEEHLPRFAGWWGHDKKSRFLMPPEFVPIAGAEAWQLSNPPILAMAAMRASADIFDEAGMQALRQKSVALTRFMEACIADHAQRSAQRGKIEIITPSDAAQRGCQLSLRTHTGGKRIHERLTAAGVICDWREPDVIRVAPVPLYNTFEDVWRFAEVLSQ